MNDMYKLNYIIEHYDSEELLRELFEKVRKNEHAIDWLNHVYAGSPDPDHNEEPFDSLDEYQRNKYGF